MDADAYLERIGYTGAREPIPDLVRQLHRAHMLAVPFENLDIRVTLLSARVYHQGEPGTGLRARPPARRCGRAPNCGRRVRRFVPRAATPGWDARGGAAGQVLPPKAVCSLPTPDGRITLSGVRLIRTAGGRREEEIVTSAEEYRALLRTHFGFELEEDAAIARLMALGAA